MQLNELQLNTLLGGWCGDAAGATLEFFRGDINIDRALKAMKMPGGGNLNVAPGQPTDDSELELALLSALSIHNPYYGFPAHDVGREYIAWYESDPFDIGQTCSRAFGFARDANEMRANAAKYNMASEANGALMRAAAIAVWAKDMPLSVVRHYAEEDAKLSHPNQQCLDVNGQYCMAIVHLLNNPGDINGAAALMEHPWLESFDINAKMNIGHVKHAFQMAYLMLKHGVNYENAILETLMSGGDTDTNAKIVGSIIAATGSDIPKYMKDPVLSFNCVEWDNKKTLMGYKRPEKYSVKRWFNIDP